MSHAHDRLSGIVDVVPPAGAAEASANRRTRTKIKRIHHHAIFTRDIEATRQLYEDVLEMKLVLTLADEGDIDPKSPSPFLHFFFEMADGSMLAFFRAVPIHDNEHYTYPALSIFDHHLSVMVEDRETQLYYKERIEAAGFKVFELDHGLCYSIYFDDPNGIHMEISYNTEEYDDHLLRAEQVARKQLETWLALRVANEGSENLRGTGIDLPESWGVKIPTKENA